MHTGMFGLRALQHWHLAHTGGAPGGPQVQHDRFPLECGELHRATVQRRKPERGQLLPAVGPQRQRDISQEPEDRPAEQCVLQGPAQCRKTPLPCQRKQPGSHKTCGGRPSAIPDIDNAQWGGEVDRTELPDKRQAGHHQTHEQRCPKARFDIDPHLARQAVPDKERHADRRSQEQQCVRQRKRTDDKGVVHRATSQRQCGIRTSRGVPAGVADGTCVRTALSATGNAIGPRARSTKEHARRGCGACRRWSGPPAHTSGPAARDGIPWWQTAGS